MRVIEDNEDIAELLQLVLESRGFEVEIVDRHFGAVLDDSKWDGIDVAVVDLMLPGGIDGIEILRWMQAQVPSVRRIILSANPLMSQEAAPYADAVLPKPAGVSQLVQTIDPKP